MLIKSHLTPEQEVVYARLMRSSYARYLIECEPGPEADCLEGYAVPGLVKALESDALMLTGPRSPFHYDVGMTAIEFRSDNSKTTSGSLHLVVNIVTGRFSADIDKGNPFLDVRGQVIHLYEVTKRLIGKLWRRIK